MSYTNEYISLVIYVDDVSIIGTDQIKIEQLKRFLHMNSLLKIYERLITSWGELEQTKDGIFVSQQRYITDILQESNMCDAKACPTLFLVGCKLQKNEGTLLTRPEQYRRLVGRLLYLIVLRDDITFVVQQLSQFMSAHTDKHLKVAPRMLKYLKGTKRICS